MVNWGLSLKSILSVLFLVEVMSIDGGGLGDLAQILAELSGNNCAFTCPKGMTQISDQFQSLHLVKSALLSSSFSISCYGYFFTEVSFLVCFFYFTVFLVNCCSY